MKIPTLVRAISQHYDRSTRLIYLIQVWRPSLVRRLLALEKKLKVPVKERSSCSGELRQAPVVELRAVRVHGLKLDALGRPIGKENTPEIHRYVTITKKEGKSPEEVFFRISLLSAAFLTLSVSQPAPAKKRTGKSNWEGREENEVVNVETRALYYYEEEGYRGCVIICFISYFLPLPALLASIRRHAS